MERRTPLTPDAGLTQTSAMRIQWHIGIVRNIHPDVNVRCAAEVPDERRSFQTPHVPLPVVAKIQ